LRLDTGAAYTFGPLHITGLQRYPASIVERLAPMQPGQPYSQTALLDYQAALQNSPYFRNAVVDADVRQAQDGVAPVDVQVTENRAQKLSFGVGVSSDTGQRVQMGWRDLDFLGAPGGCRARSSCRRASRAAICGWLSRAPHRL
jgi:Outer membrane protein